MPARVSSRRLTRLAGRPRHRSRPPLPARPSDAPSSPPALTLTHDSPTSPDATQGPALALVENARAMMERHASFRSAFRVDRETCAVAARELSAVAAQLRALDPRTPARVATRAALRGIAALESWTDEPGCGASLAKLGSPACPDSELRALALDVQIRLAGGDPAVLAVQRAAERAGADAAADAAERVRDRLKSAAAACNARDAGVHALPATAIAAAARALDRLVGAEARARRRRFRPAATKTRADENAKHLATNAEEEEEEAEAEDEAALASLSRALVPTFFSPLLGSPGSGAPAETEAAAAAAAAAWNEGERVIRAVSEATRHLGGAANGAGACARAVLAHVPVSNDMERRVSDAAAEHLLAETARGVAAPPNARSLVDSLTDELVRRMIAHAREVIAAVHVVADAEDARRNEDEERDDDDEERATRDEFATALEHVERHAPYLALSAVDAAAESVRARFAEAARTTAEVAAKKTRALITPLVSSLRHAPKFRRAGFRGAEDALADVAADATLAEAATAALRRVVASEVAPAVASAPSSSGIELRDEDESPRAFRGSIVDIDGPGAKATGAGASGRSAVERRGRDEDEVDDDEDDARAKVDRASASADRHGVGVDANANANANAARPRPPASAPRVAPPVETSREWSSRAASGSDGSHTRIIRGRSSDEGELTRVDDDDDDDARRRVVVVGEGDRVVRAVTAFDAAATGLSERRAGELDVGVAPLVAQIVGARKRGRGRPKGSAAARNAARRMLADLAAAEEEDGDELRGGEGGGEGGGGGGSRGAGKRRRRTADDDGDGDAAEPTPPRAKRVAVARGAVAAVVAPRAGMTMTTTNAAAVAAALRAGRTVLVSRAAVAALTNPSAAAARARRPGPTAEDAQVALRLGELCAAVAVDVTPETIDRFRDDLSRCPESIRSLLAPLARGVDPLIAPLRALLRFNAPRPAATTATAADSPRVQAPDPDPVSPPAAAPGPAPGPAPARARGPGPGPGPGPPPSATNPTPSTASAPSPPSRTTPATAPPPARPSPSVAVAAPATAAPAAAPERAPRFGQVMHLKAFGVKLVRKTVDVGGSVRPVRDGDAVGGVSVPVLRATVGRPKGSKGKPKTARNGSKTTSGSPENTGFDAGR